MKSYVTLLLVIFTTVGTGAQSYKMERSVVAPGVVAQSSASYRISATAGQCAVGCVASNSKLHWIGYWSGDVPVPTAVSTAAAAKLLDDGAFVSMPGMVATSAAGDFGRFFYIQNPDGTSGIRVALSPSLVAGLVRGSVMNVIGTVGSTGAEERQIVGPVAVVTGAPVPLKLRTMSNRWVGGADFGSPPFGQFGAQDGVGLNSIGLLVRTFGSVTGVGAGYVVINDGSGPLRIDTTTLSSPPAGDSYIAVTGIVSLYGSSPDRLAQILLRGDSDEEVLENASFFR